MAVTQYNSGGSGTNYTFPGNYATPVPGLREVTLNKRTFAGTTGESHNLSGPHGRDIKLHGELSGYTTRADLDTAIDTINSKIGVLFGNLSANGAAYADCTFEGIESEDGGPPFYDPWNLWTLFVVLKWRQRT